MLQYINEDEYKELLGTDSVPDNFTQYLNDASSYINYRTRARIDTDDIHENVKYATALIIQEISKAETLKEEVGNLKSQNIEGWSESYATPEEIEETLESKKKDIIKRYLWNVIGADGNPLLYCGV